MRVFVRGYAAHPLHLLAFIASFALTGYAAQRLVMTQSLRVAAWFVGAAVLHDLVLFPLYAVADATLVRLWRRRARPPLPAAPWINYLRVPAAISGLLLLIFAPSIFRLSRIYRRTTDLSSAGYLDRWLLITAALFAVSTFFYAISLRRRQPHPAGAGDG